MKHNKLCTTQQQKKEKKQEQEQQKKEEDVRCKEYDLCFSTRKL